MDLVTQQDALRTDAFRGKLTNADMAGNIFDERWTSLPVSLRLQLFFLLPVYTLYLLHFGARQTLAENIALEDLPSADEILFEDEVVIAAGRNSHWARRRKISLADLVEGPWTGPPRETMATIVLERAFRAGNLPVPKLEVTTFSVPLRHHLLTMGGFLTAMPKSLLRRSAGLKALPIVLPPHNYPIAIVTVKNRTLSPVVELFLDRLRRFASSGILARPDA